MKQGFRDATGRDWLPVINTAALLKVSERCDLTLRKLALQQVTIDDLCSGLWETVRLEASARGVHSEDEWFRECMLDDCSALSEALVCVIDKALSAVLGRDGDGEEIVSGALLGTGGQSEALQAAMFEAVLDAEGEQTEAFFDCEDREWRPRFTIPALREASRNLGITIGALTDPFSLRPDQIIRASWYGCRDEARGRGAASPDVFFQRLPLVQLPNCMRAVMTALQTAFPSKAEVKAKAPEGGGGESGPFESGETPTLSTLPPSPESESPTK